MEGYQQLIGGIGRRILALLRESPRPLFVGITGASATGKTTFAQRLLGWIRLRDPALRAARYGLDSAMLDRATRLRRGLVGYQEEANDLARIAGNLHRARSGRSFRFNAYDHCTGMHCTEITVIPAGCDVIVLDGIHAYHPRFAPLVALKLFLDGEEGALKALKEREDREKRGYSPGEARRHSEDEYRAYREHAAHYRAAADLVIRVDRRRHYSLEEAPFAPPRRSLPLRLRPDSGERDAAGSSELTLPPS
jgi:uridine kinase